MTTKESRSGDCREKFIVNVFFTFIISETIDLSVILCFNSIDKGLGNHDSLRPVLQKSNPGNLGGIIGKGDIVLFSAIRGDRKCTIEISINKIK